MSNNTNNINIPSRFNKIEEMIEKIHEKLEQTPAIIISRITEEIKNSNQEILDAIKKNKHNDSPSSSNFKKGYGNLKWGPPIPGNLKELPKLTFKEIPSTIPFPISKGKDV